MTPRVGQDLYFVGLSHSHLVGGRITFERVVIDEISVWSRPVE